MIHFAFRCAKNTLRCALFVRRSSLEEKEPDELEFPLLSYYGEGLRAYSVSSSKGSGSLALECFGEIGKLCPHASSCLPCEQGEIPSCINLHCGCSDSWNVKVNRMGIFNILLSIQWSQFEILSFHGRCNVHVREKYCDVKSVTSLFPDLLLRILQGRGWSWLRFHY